MACQTTCNSCQDCDTCQNLCESRQCSESGFTFSSCVAKNEIIGPGYFDYKVWNKGIKQINKVFREGEKGHPGEISEFTTNGQPQFLSAAEFIRVCNGLQRNDESLYSPLANHINGNKIKKDAIIYGQYFQDLEKAIANLKYHEDQCDNCNSGCNTCDGCEGNNSCCEDDE